MVDRVAGKVAVVTGGASGIGEATVRLLAEEGAKVVVADRNGDGAEAVAANIGHQAAPFTVDVGNADRVRALIDFSVQTFGGIDILHNNAAFAPATDVRAADVDLAIWEKQLRVNLTAPMLASKYAIPIMIARGGGSIIHTSSVEGLRGADTRTAYSATKSGLLGLSRSIAVQYGKQGIRSNVICPGSTLSAQLRFAPQERLEVMAQHGYTPKGLCEPLEQAAVVLFLASNEASFVNGQCFAVDGGMTAAIPMVPAMRQLNN